MTDLLKLLAAKQTVLDQLQQVERQLDPFRDEDPEARVWRSPADAPLPGTRRRCDAAAGRNDATSRSKAKPPCSAAAIRPPRAAPTPAAAADAQAAYAASAASRPGSLHLHCEG